MRYVNWLLAACILSVLVTGCSNPKKASQEQFGGQVDQARRLMARATALMADPTYFDKQTGEFSPLERILSRTQVDVASQPAEDLKSKERALVLLDSAEKILQDSLATPGMASKLARAQAKLLLGQVQLARGRYHGAIAESVRREANTTRGLAFAQLNLLRVNSLTAGIALTMDKTPVGKLSEMRTEAVAAAVKAAEDVGTFTADIKKRGDDNTKLAGDNAALAATAAKLREQSDAARGDAALSLLKQAIEKEAVITANNGLMALNQSALDAATAQLAIAEARQAGLKDRLAMLDKQLSAVDQSAQAAAAQQKAADDRAKQNTNDLLKSIEQLTAQSKTLLGREEEALSNYDKSAEKLAQAQAEIGQIRTAAPSPEAGANAPILEGLADPQHFTAAAGLAASAELARADLRLRQLMTLEANTALADQAGDLVKPKPAQASALLAAYISDPAKVTEVAEKAYKDAQNRLNAVLKDLTTEDARNIQWIYQSQLATAYMGNYQLKHDKTILASAESFADAALKGKENSPFLLSVIELKRLIASESAAPTSPAATPTSRAASTEPK